MFLLTIRRTEDGRSVVAVCEKELVGKVFEEGELVLDLRGYFFMEDGTTIETENLELISREIKKAFTSNIVGNKIVSKLVQEGLIESSSVKEICGIKYAMTVQM